MAAGLVPGPRGASGAATLVIGLLFAIAWAARHQPVPPEPTADLYTHLSVARHLVRGEGFLSDVVYPLSLAFPFAARVPQPLIDRPPGYSLLLTAPVLAAGDDPVRAEAAARWLHVGLLLALACAGTRAARRAGLPEAVAPWLLLLLTSPLLAMTAGWAQSETPAALLLGLAWWRWRDSAAPTNEPPARRGAADGALAAAVALVRADLVWVPWLWLAARGRLRPRAAALTALCAWLLLLAPWTLRNARLTGDPFFNLQAQGELVKETPAWPGYDIYRSLSPQPAWRVIATQPKLVLTKTAAGLRYFAARLGRWLPWPLWLAAVLLLLPRRAGVPGRRARGPLALLLLTLVPLTLQYAALSHTVRYLAVVLPALALEIWLCVAAWLRDLRPGWRPAARAALLAAWAVALQLAAPAHLPGWEEARRAALAQRPAVERAAASAAALPAGPLFTDSSGVLWLAGRAGVWLPRDAEVTARIRATVPEMAAAPTILVGPPPP